MFRSFARCFSKLGPTDLKGRKTAAQKWLVRQWNDPYVKRARLESYRCRSAFKLLEIDDKYDILRAGSIVIDCGASPGSWSQVAVNKVNVLGTDANKPCGLVISVDLLNIFPISGAVILENCDVTSSATQQRIREILNGRPVDLVLSDIAPSATGVSSLDHEQIVKLAMTVLRMSATLLKEAEGDKLLSGGDGGGGKLLVKLWQGRDTSNVMDAMQKCFSDVRIVKPAASRANSAEIYLLAQGFSLEVNRSKRTDREIVK